MCHNVANACKSCIWTYETIKLTFKAMNCVFSVRLGQPLIKTTEMCRMIIRKDPIISIFIILHCYVAESSNFVGVPSVKTNVILWNVWNWWKVARRAERKGAEQTVTESLKWIQDKSICCPRGARGEPPQRSSLCGHLNRICLVEIKHLVTESLSSLSSIGELVRNMENSLMILGDGAERPLFRQGMHMRHVGGADGNEAHTNKQTLLTWSKQPDTIVIGIRVPAQWEFSHSQPD